MRPFRDRPIATKALVLGIVPTMTAIVLVLGLSMLSTYLMASSNLQRDVDAELALVSDSISAALAFGDQRAAADALRPYRSKTNIDAVCVFDTRDVLFASFSRKAGACTTSESQPESAIIRETDVLAGGHRVGKVRVAGNFNRLSVWVQRQAFVGFGTFLIGAILSLILTRKLGRSITEPLEHLAATADRVSTAGDYHLRATRMSDDEVGRLVSSFNQMLDQIQAQHEASAETLMREQEASRAKDHFLAAISHELRTPLNAILGWVQVIQTTKPTPGTLQRALDSLDRNARAQARVVDDLIEVSRVATGKLQLRVDTVDLRQVVRAALDVVDAALKAKSIRPTFVQPPDPCLVSGDADRLRQIMWNLLSNAAKFTPSGGEVQVSIMRAGAEYVVTVSDTGIGIAPEFMPYIFDRFRQADGSMTREHGGLGLGLAIARDLVELHGGSILASSGGKGKGAVFTMSLPVLPSLTVIQKPAIVPIPAGDALLGLQVLAVDDDTDALEVIAEGLRSFGAAVRTAHSGSEALDLWDDGSADVLVCDLAMPQMDGYEVLRKIRGAGAPDGHVMAIALSAHTSDGDRQRSLAAGFERHLAKPLDLQQLVGVILECGQRQPPASRNSASV